MGAAEHRRIRAPVEQGGLLVCPPLAEAANLVRANRSLISSYQIRIGGVPLAQLRALARRELLESTVAYHHQAGESDAVSQGAVSDGSDFHRPLILAGHQPELYHAGVWFKNFLLHRVARDTGGWAVNLIADSDLARRTSLRVPSGSWECPRVVSEPIDRPGQELPWEERKILDAEFVGSFAERAAELVRPFSQRPLVTTMWPAVIECAGRGGGLGEAICRARRRLERDWGVVNWECPVSRCLGEAWRIFAQAICRDIVRFHAAYNGALADYRRAHRIRSAAQPLPDLSQEGGRWELPFWIWSSDSPERKPMDWGEGDEWPDDRFKVRPRALALTIFARLLLGDAFIHGIGGGKYDEVSDEIIRRFFGLTPPKYLTATATVRLADKAPEGSDLARELVNRLRSLQFHPEHHLPAESENRPEIAFWIENKRNWVNQEMPRGSRGERHRGIVESNARLAEAVVAERAEVEAELARVVQSAAARKAIGSREFSFCLFEEQILRPVVLEKLFGKS